MSQIMCVTDMPWMGTGEVPAMPLERDEKSRIEFPIVDPIFDIDGVPVYYTNSRWCAFVYEADEKDLKKVLPEPLKLEDDVVEFWYVLHHHTRLGPYYEFGITISASYEGYKGGYYPYMYLTSDAGVEAGRVLGFPKKMAFIRVLEHGGKWDDGIEPPGNDYFSFLIARRGYVMHTATGKYSGNKITDLARLPMFYGKKDWGRFNYRILSSSDLSETIHQLTFLPSEYEGIHRFQLQMDTIRTAQADDINWFSQGTPYDNFAAMVPVKKLIGLVSFTFNLIIPAAQVLWTKKVTRSTPEDFAHCLKAKPYKYGMAHRFPKPIGV
ncbi:acetoacetate decarboxylase family protein [Desulfofundulus thermocisternus]|uniref:acetoacetate decarboxylase family protein n=1 Tax=Desulfofundulus thermocisternus TaxID=42471 RepID=UPI00217E9970|nr:acetoacetate decarboxylase family protein [Desulfofundulus thermocisternus]MCS5695027.1 acetoacetate decarboxylase family protein [Desulfofundulus thermocisternus]